MHSLK